MTIYRNIINIFSYHIQTIVASMSTPYIVQGYNGIMDLDLTHIPQQYHADMVRLHLQDIADYKIEQQMRPERMRYENTVTRSREFWERYDLAQKKRRGGT